MKRNILFSLIATLTFLGGQTITPASAFVGDSAYHWSLQELMGAIDGSNNDMWDNPYCQDQGMEMMENRCMQAIQQFQSLPIIVTAVNPSTSTIRLLFRDVNLMYGSQSTGVDLHLFWSESVESVFDVMYGQPNDSIQEFFYQSTTDLSTGLLQFDREIEITVENGELLSQPPYYVLYVLDEGGEPVTMAGVAQFHTCFQAGSGYQPGMECTAMFDDYMNIIYVPTVVSNDRSEQPDTAVPTEDITAMPSGEGYGGNTPNIIEATTNVPSTPDTGSATNIDEGATEFPWWLGLIFCFGLATLVWFLWPIRRQKS